MLNFEELKQGWRRLYRTRRDDIRRRVPLLDNPDLIYLKRIREDTDTLVVEFRGLENAVDDATAIPQVKSLLVDWLKGIRTSVQIIKSITDVLTVRIAKTTRLEEDDNFYKTYQRTTNLSRKFNSSPKYDRRMIRLTHIVGRQERRARNGLPEFLYE